METGLTREEALKALQTYNHEPFHLQHALTVEAVMGWFAKEEGFEAESDFWHMAGCCMTLTSSSGLNSIA